MTADTRSLARAHSADIATGDLELVVVGVSHRTAPVAVREQVAFTAGEIAAAHDAARTWAIEAFVLSTCNRVELYGVFAPGTRGADVFIDLLATSRGVSAAQLRAVVYVRTGAAAVRHLHAVAAGLDSVVLGETEILAQLRAALSVARARGTLGLILDRLGASAVNGARWAHRRHGGQERESVAARALQEVGRVRGSIRGATIAILGAGQLASRAAALARAAHVARLIIVNRTGVSAAALASRYGGEPWTWERRHEAIAVADVALLCTGAHERVVDTTALFEARRASGERPLVCVDLAVPRALEPDVTSLPGITLLDLDTLPGTGAGGPDADFIAALERSVDIAVARFDAWRRARTIVRRERAGRGGAA
jgi:glutamyl-tRNA reductase